MKWTNPPEGWCPPPLTDPQRNALGSVPRGFYETATPEECDDLAPAFLRGLLVPQHVYDQKGLFELLQFPRWTLYRGPFEFRQEALRWASFMFFWANANNHVWIDETPCIVRSSRLKWPADATQRWDWVYETSPPRRVKRVWDSATGYRYVWE